MFKKQNMITDGHFIRRDCQLRRIKKGLFGGDWSATSTHKKADNDEYSYVLLSTSNKVDLFVLHKPTNKLTYTLLLLQVEHCTFSRVDVFDTTT